MGGSWGRVFAQFRAAAQSVLGFAKPRVTSKRSRTPWPTRLPPPPFPWLHVHTQTYGDTWTQPTAHPVSACPNKTPESRVTARTGMQATPPQNPGYLETMYVVRKS